MLVVQPDHYLGYCLYQRHQPVPILAQALDHPMTLFELEQIRQTRLDQAKMHGKAGDDPLPWTLH